MDKYRGHGDRKLNSKQHPDMQARDALANASFASKEREYFFDGVYGEILVDYFVQWLQTEPHETKAREFIYNSALALGDVKSRLIQYEMYGTNVRFMEDNDEGN